MMSFEDEVSLSDSTPVEPVERGLGESGEFVFAEFLAGVRARRKSVRVYARRDLEQHIDRLRADALDLLNRGEFKQAEALQEDMKRLAEQHAAQSLDIVLEERSREWMARTLASLKEQGVAEGLKGTARDARLQLYLIGEQIVDPPEVDGDFLVEMAETIPGEVERIARAWETLHEIGDERLLPFSRRS